MRQIKKCVEDDDKRQRQRRAKQKKGVPVRSFTQPPCSWVEQPCVMTPKLFDNVLSSKQRPQSRQQAESGISLSYRRHSSYHRYLSHHRYLSLWIMLSLVLVSLLLLCVLKALAAAHYCNKRRPLPRK